MVFALLCFVAAGLLTLGVVQKDGGLRVMASLSCAVSGVFLYAASEVIVYLAVLVADLKACN